MSGNRLVSVTAIDTDHIVVSKSRGKLLFSEIAEALRKDFEDESFVVFVRSPQFDGYLGETEKEQVKLIRLETIDHCPICSQAIEDIRSRIYDEAYEYGYKTAKEEGA